MFRIRKLEVRKFRGLAAPVTLEVGDRYHLIIGDNGAGKTNLLKHFELLLVLARARIEDADHPPAERGWRYADALQRGLGLEGTQFNLYIFRARQQFGEAEVAGAASTGQVRLGVERIEVVSLG